MNQKKLSLANIQGKLSRAEMKKIMAGSATGCSDITSSCLVGDPCLLQNGQDGWCYSNSSGTSCYCGGAS
ncbi:MAG TPA: hypothetical protein VF008_25945 [Niastella sp.]